MTKNGEKYKENSTEKKEEAEIKGEDVKERMGREMNEMVELLQKQVKVQKARDK